jgi:hypothetical protein
MGLASIPYGIRSTLKKNGANSPSHAAFSTGAHLKRLRGLIRALSLWAPGQEPAQNVSKTGKVLSIPGVR